MLQTLFESALDAIVVIDDGGRFIDANPAACELFGISPATASRHTLDHFLGDRAFVNSICRGERQRGDLQVTTSDGRHISIEYRAKANFMPGRHLAILRDITERERVERELRANAEFLRRLIESSHDCIKVLDLTGRLVSMNEGGRKLLEMDAVEPYVGSAWLDFWDGGERDQAAEALAQARRGEVARFEGRGATMRGTMRWWETVIAPIHDAEGVPERLIAVSRDITHRVQQDRAKDEFLATLAHELRNPLAAILNGVATLDVIGSPTPNAAAARAVIRRQTQHLARLLDDLLDVSRVREGKIALQVESIDLVATVQAALDGERPRFERKRHTVTTTLPSSPLYVRADGVRLRQVVANLLNNASKYTPADGHVAVEVEATGDEAILRVRDDGVGIPAERLDDVFQLFTQLDRPRGSEGGLGIGLALVRRLVELQGGRVTAESEGTGRGSTFTVRLPLATAPAAKSPAAHGAADARRERVVLIEDNDDTRELLAAAISRAGHEVATAGDAESGLARVASLDATVVIADIGLPDRDGYAVAREVRALRGSKCLMIAFSGYGQPEDRARSALAGFDAHVIKPVDPDALLRLIADMSRAAGARPQASELA